MSWNISTMKSKKQNKINIFQWTRFIFSFKNLLKHCDNDKVIFISKIIQKEMKKRGI